MENPFTWEYMTTLPPTDQVFDPFAIAYLIVVGLGFLISTYLYNDGAKRYAGNPIKRRAIQRGAGIAMIVFGVGLFFFGVRVLQINPFSFGLPIWLWLSVLAVLLMTAYFVYYARAVYPAQLRAYEQSKLKQQYMKPSAATPGAAGPARPGSARPARKRRR